MYRAISIMTLAPAMVLLAGCEQDLDLDRYRNPDTARMLVVNSIINPDSLMAVSVTRPFFFSDPNAGFDPVTSLDVRLTGADGNSEILSFDHSSNLYLSGRRPDPGEAIRLEINGDDEWVTSCDTLPQRVPIESVDVTGEGPVHIFWDEDYRFTYKITFRDPAGQENFYFLAIEDDGLYYEMSDMGQVDYTADYVFQVLAAMVNSDIKGWRPGGVFGYPFCDKGIDGRRYTVTVSEVFQQPWVDMIPRLPRRVNLYSISRAYFQYMVSVLSMDYEQSALKGNLLSLGLVEPGGIYSNIHAGTGLMGCYTLHTERIDLLELTNGWPKK